MQIGDFLPYRSWRGQVIHVEHLSEDGYAWCMVTLRLETGREVEVNTLDLEEVRDERMAA